MAADPNTPGRWRGAMDLLVGATGLLGGVLLLSRTRREQAAPGRAGQPASGSPQAQGAESGRGRPGTPPTLEAEHLGHEPLDANAGIVALVMTGLAASVVAAVIVLFLVLDLFHSQLEASRPSLTQEQLAPEQPPEPNLVTRPDAYLRAVRARENGALESYRWRDADHTAAHVPIARAMALTVGRGLDPAP